MREDPFPTEAVRDLLGLVRAMYREAVVRGAGRPELTKLERIGQSLKNAVKLGTCPPHTLGHASAWKQVESANQELASAINPLRAAKPIIDAAIRPLFDANAQE